MTIRKPLWAALGVLVIVAGCDSPRQAEGTGRSNNRRSQANRAAPQRPPTPAEEMARMDKLMAACPDFDRRVREFRSDLARLAGAAQPVANLRPALDEVDDLRAKSVHIMGRRISIWAAICEVSTSADAMNSAIAKADLLVRRCEQIVRLKSVIAADSRIFNNALAEARRRPAKGTIDDLRQAAWGFGARIRIISKTMSELDGMLAGIESPLRYARDTLQSVTTSALRDTAQEMAYRLGRVLAAASNARREIGRYRANTGKLTTALEGVSAGLEVP